MNDRDIRSLTEDALFDRRIQRNGCFVTNEAGAELLRGEDSYLPIIEDAIREVVVPEYQDKVVIECQNRLHGLVYVLGAYLVVGTRADPQRVFTFLPKLPPQLQVRVIGAIGTFFVGPFRRDAFRWPPTSELIEYLEFESKSDDSMVSSNAAATVERVRRWL